MKKSKKIKRALRKDILSLYKIAEVVKGKKSKGEIYYAINHLNNVLEK